MRLSKVRWHKGLAGCYTECQFETVLAMLPHKNTVRLFNLTMQMINTPSSTNFQNWLSLIDQGACLDANKNVKSPRGWMREELLQFTALEIVFSRWD